MAANMYRVGGPCITELVKDYVYFETSSTSPYQIRRIEELCKTQTGNVEAKVMCFYRRRDISSSLINLADKHQSYLDEEPDETGVVATKEELNDKQKHQLKHRELFLSRQVETLPATHIRGKCSITLLNETELFMSYLGREDTFFYSLVYDPQQKTLLADKGEIRVGSNYQAEPTPLLKEGESDGRDLSTLEELHWSPTDACTDKQLNQFLIVARSVGAFARALDCTSTVRQPSLHMSAAAASRDITLFHAMNVLHKCDYDLTSAMSNLVPSTGPVLCRDEMEEWSASEANLFEEALDKYGKDFNDIRQDFLPWKTLKSIIEYYYMWKTTDRYVQQKRIKAAEAESKLKQVYIPNYNKPNPAQINEKTNGVDVAADKACESCYTSHSAQWFSWGPVHMQCRLCASCWVYWKKYGGLKMPTRLDGSTAGDKSNQLGAPPRSVKCSVANCGREFRSKTHLAQHLASSHGLMVRSSSPGPVMKTRAAFCLVTTPLTRISRQICKNILDITKAARRPFSPINVVLIKQECQQHLPELMNKLCMLKAKKRVPMEKVSARLGIDIKMEKPLLLHHTDDKKSAQQRSKPVTGQEGGRKRGSDHINGSEDGPAAKQSNTSAAAAATSRSIHLIQPKLRGATLKRLNNGCSSNGAASSGKGDAEKKLPKWMKTPEDIFYMATDSSRQARRQLTGNLLKRGARKPGNTLSGSKKGSGPGVVVLD